METTLFKIHKNLKATFTTFAGWRMPLHYGSALEEVKSVRSKCGIFDISHMGRILVSGGRAREILQRLSTNNVENLKPMKVQYSLITNEQGGIKDDVTIYCFDEDKYMLCVNAVNRKKICEWLGEFININDISDTTVQIALQGPRSGEILSKFFDVSDIKYYTFKIFDDIIVSRTGYTGELGYEIYAEVKKGIELFEELLKYCPPCGLASRDILRIEAGFPLYGNEIDEDITPFEAGLERFVYLGKDFVGKETMLSKERRRRLIHFLVKGRGIPRSGYKIISDEGEAGYVTSGTFSPTYNRCVGMAFIRSEIPEDAKLYIDIRSRKVEIESVDNLLKYLKSVKTVR